VVDYIDTKMNVNVSGGYDSNSALPFCQRVVTSSFLRLRQHGFRRFDAMALAADHLGNSRNIISGTTSDFKYSGGSVETGQKALKNRWMDPPKPGVKLGHTIVVDFHLRNVRQSEADGTVRRHSLSTITFFVRQSGGLGETRPTSALLR
jgi:hypothetical protein